MAHELGGDEFYPERGDEYPPGVGQEEAVTPVQAEELDAEALDEAAVAVEAIEVEEVQQPPTQRQRAAMRSGQHIGRYVKRPRGDDDAKRGSHVKSAKDRRKRLRELQYEDNHRPKGLGLQWWLNQIKQARATHGEACSCLYCSSPYN